jgi:hypothetical protein
MKYVIFEGNYRLNKKVKKLQEFDTLDEALDEIARQKNHGKDAYIVETPEV